MVSLYTAKFGDHNSIVVVEMFLVVEGQDSTYPGLSMRPARSRSCRQARWQINLPARLIAQAT